MSNENAEQRRDALVERIFNSSLGAVEILSIYIGDRLGLYRALADSGEATASALATATGIHERYAREWLEQQAVSSLLEVEDRGVGPRPGVTGSLRDMARCSWSVTAFFIWRLSRR